MKKNFTLRLLSLLFVALNSASVWAATVSFQAVSRGEMNGNTFTAAGNAGNGYAMAIADLSGIEGITTAGTVTIEYESKITTNSRWLIGIGDKTVRGTNANGSSKAGYVTDGLFIWHGTKDGTYYRVNDGTNNSDAMDVTAKTTFTLDKDNGKFSYTIIDVNTNDVLFSASDMSANYANATIVEVYSWLGNATIDLSPVTVTLTASEAEYADYTVRYVCEGYEIKESVTRNGIVGQAPILLPSDKDPIYTQGNSEKYIYESDDASEQEIAFDGSTEVTINFRMAEEYYAILNLDLGVDYISEYKGVWVFEGDGVTLHYPRYYMHEGVVYVAPATGTDPKTKDETKPVYGFYYPEGGSYDIVYSESVDLAFACEVENMTYSHRWAADDGDVPARYSNGRAPRLYLSSYCYTEPIAEAGEYKLTLWARNRSSSQVSNISVAITDGVADDEGNLTLTDLGLVIGDWATGDQGEKTLEGVMIPAGYCLVLNNDTEYNSNLEMDYLTLERTGDYASGVATAIQTVNVEKEDNAVFNLQGQRVSNPAHGIFITKGRKVVF